MASRTDNAKPAALAWFDTKPQTDSQRLDDVLNRIEDLRATLNEVLRSQPKDAPLFMCADLVIGLCHLKRAEEVIERASDTLEAAAVEAVNR
ncbi:hypothetical protein [Mycolicibacterium fortuitum]|jgi:hypothetical protein|uniref:hypothetical protein n=1 Tax=Mycolicibacterium fortuitum TaxID=1766 RepID=UPI003AAC22D9